MLVGAEDMAGCFGIMTAMMMGKDRADLRKVRAVCHEYGIISISLGEPEH